MEFTMEIVNSIKLNYYQSKMKLYSRKIKKATMYAEEVDSWKRIHGYYHKKFDKIIDKQRD